MELRVYFLAFVMNDISRAQLDVNLLGGGSSKIGTSGSKLMSGAGHQGKPGEPYTGRPYEYPFQNRCHNHLNIRYLSSHFEAD